MKQNTPIRKTCQHRSQCLRDAVVGLYHWELGETDVNLDKPVRVYCGVHKPRLTRDMLGRNVRLRTRR